MDKYERLLRRMLVLTSWGYSADFHGSLEKCEEYLSTNEKLEEWYGSDWQGSGTEVTDELDAIDLIASAK